MEIGQVMYFHKYDVTAIGQVMYFHKYDFMAIGQVMPFHKYDIMAAGHIMSVPTHRVMTYHAIRASQIPCSLYRGNCYSRTEELPILTGYETGFALERLGHCRLSGI
jgi:hypothetical protein